MQRAIFRKTPAGQAELRSRSLGLDARARTLLILANGQLSVADLDARVGFDPLGLLSALAGQGLLETASPAAKPRPAAAVPAPVVHPLAPADLPAARTRAITQLAPHYGPDALRMAEPLRAAASPTMFAQALATLRETMSVHMGRKLAEQIAKAIAHGVE